MLEEKTYLNMADEEVLKLSQENPKVFGVIVDRYQGAFLRKAKYIMKDEDRAEDVVSEAMLKIYSKAHTFVPNGDGSFRAWSYTILIRTAFSHFKKEYRADVVAFTDEFAEVLGDVSMISKHDQYEMGDIITRVLNTMPDSFATVINKFFLEGKTHEEIAREEGLSVEASKVRLHRAKKLFKNITSTMAI